MLSTYSNENFHHLCDQVALTDQDLRQILDTYGYPPMWIRPGTFQTLVLTILEQQLSLAAAYAAFRKLRERIGFVTPKKLLALTDEELRACYFSRQKIVYARGLAEAIISRKINLRRLAFAADEEVRATLTQLKGIGDWTVDVYLMHALQRNDLFPLGDIALVNSLKFIKKLPSDVTKVEMLKIAEAWRPYRTIAAMILWHAYIKRKGLKIAE